MMPILMAEFGLTAGMLVLCLLLRLHVRRTHLVYTEVPLFLCAPVALKHRICVIDEYENYHMNRHTEVLGLVGRKHDKALGPSEYRNRVVEAVVVQACGTIEQCGSGVHIQML
jgi:hypothetical protein